MQASLYPRENLQVSELLDIVGHSVFFWFLFKAIGTGQASQAMAWPVLAAQFLKNSYKESEKC